MTANSLFPTPDLHRDKLRDSGAEGLWANDDGIVGCWSGSLISAGEVLNRVQNDASSCGRVVG